MSGASFSSYIIGLFISYYFSGSKILLNDHVVYWMAVQDIHQRRLSNIIWMNMLLMKWMLMLKTNVGWNVGCVWPPRQTFRPTCWTKCWMKCWMSLTTPHKHGQTSNFFGVNVGLTAGCVWPGLNTLLIQDIYVSSHFAVWQLFQSLRS